MYEGLYCKSAFVLEEDTQDHVATKTTISGNIGKMILDSWELLWNLLKNAFFGPLNPVFENLKTHASKKKYR
jgi:streptogramin lyase